MNVLQSPNALLKQKVFFKPAFAISAANASFLGCHFLMVCVTWRTNEALWCCSVDRPLGCADESIRLFLQNPLPMTQTCLSVRNSYGWNLVSMKETISLHSRDLKGAQPAWVDLGINDSLHFFHKPMFSSEWNPSGLNPQEDSVYRWPWFQTEEQVSAFLV